MTYELVHDFPNLMMFEKKMPCISLYLPTHRHVNDAQQDRIMFKNLIRTIAESLHQKYPDELIKELLKRFIDLEKDDDFWLNPTEGLAIFTNPDHQIIYKLHTPVDPLTIVSNSFHIKPLIQYFQSLQNVQLLGLDAEGFTLYEGNRYGIKPIVMDPDVPRTLEDAIGIHKADSYLARAAYAGLGAGMMHGRGGRKDESEKSTEKFFRYVDKFVYENYSRESKCPLILLALAEYHNEFMKLSNNPFLMKEGIKGDYSTFDENALQNKTNALLEPLLKQKLQDKIDRFNAAKTESLGSDQLSDIVKAALDKRIETVLIESNRIIPGKINLTNQKIEYGHLEATLLDDVLDDLAELVLLNKGEVLLVPQEMMTTKNGIAAIYRY